ncbi:glycosyltransferase [Helicobacter sp. MIT 01-3238]|uniref:glycosyltransferase n=1 Tax=Helicobacter sp. MIT 01-3238 TaxID=398627 RepID=UPI000E1F519F|nr:glycosyltransferase [Helicobacter sp. MIT 01-3238]RDU51319.1 hypothetical protein CQA40_10535 [Helicobacter sp. MIT 01-3238]
MLKIPVFLASDDKYAPFVATTMASILMHTNDFIEFYIMDCGISTKNKKKICKTDKYFKNFSIEFLEIDIEKYFSKFPELEQISRAMYARYLIPLLKPDIDKAIYSDIDVAFVKDVRTLFCEELGGKIIGAVPSQRGNLNNNYKKEKEKLNLSPSHQFFMSGLLLINCNLWRKNDITSKLFEQTAFHSNCITLPDQEIFNIVFDNNYMPLDKKYCVIYKIFDQVYTKEQIDNLVKEQVIIHYPGGGDSKPWNNKKLKSAEYFYEAVKFTDFRKEIAMISKKKPMIKKILHNIFDVRNNSEKTHKVVTILGINLKFRKKIRQKDLIKTIEIQNDKIKAIYTLLNSCVDITKVPKARGELRKLQMADTLALDIFDRLCTKHSLTYWLDYGSLLGAVRHRGFIPWDDDVDVAMIRGDYEKIRTIFRNDFEKLGFEVNEGIGYYRQIIRLKYKNSAIQIDIFPHDFYFKDIDSRVEEIELSNKIVLCNKQFFQEQPLEYLQQGKIKFSYEKLQSITNNVILQNNKIDTSNGALFSGCEYICYDKPKIISNKLLFPLKRASFEDIELFIPNNSDLYLKKIYGDYFSFPDFSDPEMCAHKDIMDKCKGIDDIIIELKNIIKSDFAIASK